MGPLGDDLRCGTYGRGNATTSVFEAPDAPGPATPLFLIPALGLDGRSLAPAARLTPTRRVVLWNTPNDLPRTRGLDALADLALAHAARAGIDRRFVIGGASLGGMIALAATLRAPERVAGLVTFSAAAAWKELGPLLELARWMHPFIPRRTYGIWLARTMLPAAVDPPEGSPINDALRLQMKHRSREYGASVVTAVAGGGGFDLRPRLGEVRAPALIVHGSRDKAIPVAAAKTLAAIPGSRLVEVDTGSHVPLLSASDGCLAALREFLAQVDRKETTA